MIRVDLKRNPSIFSPSRSIHIRNAETYRPITGSVGTARRDSAFHSPEGNPRRVPHGQDKRDVIEAQAREADETRREILGQRGV